MSPKCKQESTATFSLKSRQNYAKIYYNYFFEISQKRKYESTTTSFLKCHRKVSKNLLLLFRNVTKK